MLPKVLLFVALLTIAACSDSDGPVAPEVWSSEPLHSGLQISFTDRYEGDGVSCGMDACWFAKNRIDKKATFHISVWGMTGGLPVELGELPATYTYPDTEYLSTSSGLEGAFYSQLQADPETGRCSGTYFIAKSDGAGFVEAVRVSYAHGQRAHVKDVLRSIEY